MRILIVGFLLLMVACHRPVETVRAPSPQPELMAIDTLMQTRPDSALALLLPCRDGVHTVSTMDNHYYQLLLSEALYKNDSAQLNRAELLNAVAYFDSIPDAFLSARAHYMKGVGYYETDSVVQACAEYLKALEIMETHFEEKDLVGQKAKFMALTYTRLCKLFSDWYLHEQAIYFGKQSLPYYYKYDATFWHIAWMLDKTGLHYHMIGQLDSANYYYEVALALIPDTNNVTYRDVKTAHTLLSYRTGKNPQLVMEQLHGLLVLSESDGEYLSRCLTIGNVFYNEQQFDSALTYLNKVFDESTRIGSRKQAAEWLVEICKSQGKSYETYADFLVPFANQEENNSGIKSQITKQYNEYNQRKQELVDNNTRKRLKRNGLSVVGMMFALGSGFVIYHIISKRKHRLLQIQMEATAKQLEDERQAHRVQQAALGSRLKQKNLALKELSATHETKPTTEPSPPEAVGDYTAEAICKHILSVCSNHQNPIKSSLPSSAYANIALNDKQKAQLKDAANRHFGNLFEKLKKRHPELKDKDFLYCSLCLLELNNVQIAALLQKSTSTIWEREKRLQVIFGKNEKIAMILNSLMNN